MCWWRDPHQFLLSRWQRHAQPLQVDSGLLYGARLNCCCCSFWWWRQEHCTIGCMSGNAACGICSFHPASTVCLPRPALKAGRWESNFGP
jgi:hypothetical protein